MKRTLVISLFIVFLLTSCEQESNLISASTPTPTQTSIPTMTPTLTPTPTYTPTPILTPTPTPIPTPTLSPTLSPVPTIEPTVVPSPTPVLEPWERRESSISLSNGVVIGLITLPSLLVLLLLYTWLNKPNQSSG